MRPVCSVGVLGDGPLHWRERQQLAAGAGSLGGRRGVGLSRLLHIIG